MQSRTAAYSAPLSSAACTGYSPSRRRGSPNRSLAVVHANRHPGDFPQMLSNVFHQWVPFTRSSLCKNHTLTRLPDVAEFLVNDCVCACIIPPRSPCVYLIHTSWLAVIHARCTKPLFRETHPPFLTRPSLSSFLSLFLYLKLSAHDYTYSSSWIIMSICWIFIKDDA